MKINFYNQDVQLKLHNKIGIRKWIAQVAQAQTKRVGEISFVFCSDDYLLGVNRQYLQHDYYTDVITFDYSENNRIGGDIFISIDTVSDNAVTLGVTFEHELHRVMIHGVLHLCGYSDHTDEEKQNMRTLENQYLQLL